VLDKIKKSVFKNYAKKLLAKMSSTVAQAGQDSWVINDVHNRRTNGYFVEVGAHDGLELSNTYLLETRYKWNGLCIEANPHSFKTLRSNRGAACLNVCVDECEGEVVFNLDGMMGGIVEYSNENIKVNETVSIKSKSLTQILDANSAPSVIDYLSIDVEGAEEKILSSFNFDKYRFFHESHRHQYLENAFHTGRMRRLLLMR